MSYMTFTCKPNVFKKCKLSLKIIFNTSNICTRGLSKRDYHGIEPLLPDNDVQKHPEQGFLGQWNPAAC